MLMDGKDRNSTIKVITGMRRCGKSTLLDQYESELVSLGVSEEDIVRINLELPENQHISDKNALNQWILENIPRDRQVYVFLDEIQNVDGWEKSLAGLEAMGNCDTYITGSNSKLLSSELSTHITGRYIEIRMQPFSFREYLEMYPSDNKDRRFIDFLRYGGIPIVDPDSSEKYRAGILEGIFNSILVNDVLNRLRTDDVSKVISIARYLYSNIGNITNIDNISKEIGISGPTVDRYVEAMEKAYLFYHCERYDIVGKNVLKTNGKYYASDLGMRNQSVAVANARDMSKPLENIVYMELLRRGYKVNVGCYKDSEVDFTALKDGRVEYFQVSQTIMEENTYQREIRPYRGIKDNFRKTILTMDRFGLGTDEGIEIVNMVDWLLDEK
jgi:hypothetical protein